MHDPVTSGVTRQSRSLFGAPWTREALEHVPIEKILEAQDRTGQRVTQLLITLFGVVSFCFLSLLAPDSNLLESESNLDVPFAGRVSFLGFMIIGPILLVGLRLYLSFFHQHWMALELAVESSSAVKAPTVSLLTDPRLRLFSGFLLYCAVPLLMFGFLWKAAGLPGWGAYFLPATAAVVGWHLAAAAGSSPRLRLLRAAIFLLPVAASLLVAGLYPDRLRRPMQLSRADLADANLAGADLRGADLRYANLERANLQGVKLDEADLFRTNLQEANLNGARLVGAELAWADLRGADLSGDETGAPAEQAGLRFAPANLDGAYLSYADLRSADLRGTRFEGARLIGADLRNATLLATDFIDADLSRVKAQDLDFQESVLWGAELSGAYLLGANLGLTSGLEPEQVESAEVDETTRLPF